MDIPDPVRGSSANTTKGNPSPPNSRRERAKAFLKKGLFSRPPNRAKSGHDLACERARGGRERLCVFIRSVF